MKTLPGVREAVERRQWADVEPAVRAVARAIGSYTTEADRAAELLEQAVRTDQVSLEVIAEAQSASSDTAGEAMPKP